jgi:hypothetical protein
MLHTSRIFNVNKHNMINKEEMKRRLWKAKVLKTWRNFGHENSPKLQKTMLYVVNSATIFFVPISKTELCR